MLTEFIKGRQYKVQDYETLVMKNGVRKDDCGYLTMSLYATLYHKRMEPDVADEVFTGEGGDLTTLKGWCIRPWMCKLVPLTEFVPGKEYKVLTREYMLENIDGIDINSNDSLRCIYGGNTFPTDMDEVEGNIFTAERTDHFHAGLWTILPWMCEEVPEPKKTVYIAGNMLTKDSQLLRAQEREEIEYLGYNIYNPQDNAEINDKANLDNNDGLAEKIVRQDTDALIKSDIIVIEPQPYALGTMVELGQIKGMKDMASIIMSIVKDPRLDDTEVREYIQEECQSMLDKLILPHYEDIRRVDTPETGDRRSLGINQYVYGVALDLSNGQGFYDWADILLQLGEEQ